MQKNMLIPNLTFQGIYAATDALHYVAPVEEKEKYLVRVLKKIESTFFKNAVLRSRLSKNNLLECTNSSSLSGFGAELILAAPIFPKKN